MVVCCAALVAMVDKDVTVAQFDGVVVVAVLENSNQAYGCMWISHYGCMNGISAVV